MTVDGCSFLGFVEFGVWKRVFIGLFVESEWRTGLWQLRRVSYEHTLLVPELLFIVVVEVVEVVLVAVLLLVGVRHFLRGLEVTHVVFVKHVSQRLEVLDCRPEHWLSLAVRLMDFTLSYVLNQLDVYFLNTFVTTFHATFLQGLHRVRIRKILYLLTYIKFRNYITMLSIFLFFISFFSLTFLLNHPSKFTISSESFTFELNTLFRKVS